MALEQEIQQLTACIWDTVLNLPIQSETVEHPAGPHEFSAEIDITGAWCCSVQLACGEGMAADAAAIMFGSRGAALRVTDRRDAVGELVNMIGGNLKALLPPPCHLSLPRVVEGAHCFRQWSERKTVAHVPLRCGAHTLIVNLLQRSDDPGPASSTVTP